MLTKDVSILARLNGRALPRLPVMQSGMATFQSSPGLMAGRYFRHSAFLPLDVVFQSSPGLMAGRYWWLWRR